jgi:pimeloyl-ACP methyl ester carboxylesterase
VLPEPTTTVTLPDGRLLACDDLGDPRGWPVLWLHGAPDSRLARHPDDGLAAAAGIRLLAVDRPGYGWSDPPAPDPLTFGDELGLLLDGLGVEACTVAAWSAGAPWAVGAACALGRSRVTGVATFGAVAPFEALCADPDAAAASGGRSALAAAVAAGEATPDDVADELAMLLVPTPPVPLEQARDLVLESLAPHARAALDAAPEIVDALATSLLAAIERHGDAGVRADLAVQLCPGIEELLAGVECPVVLVHGDLDETAGPAVGRWFAARLDDARLEVWEGAGHQAVLLEWERWLEAVSGAR